MNSHLLWDDLRVILAIEEAGSLSGAGRRLGLSHATVFRRLNQIEKRLGVKLFDRQAGGYSPTMVGEEAAQAARTIEAEVMNLERRVAGLDLQPSGTVRLTTTDSLFAGLLSPILADFGRHYPDIHLEVVVSNQLFNLTRREADIALRPSSFPPETLIGRRIGIIAQAVYGRRELIEAVAGQDPMAVLPWIEPDEHMGYRELDQWLRFRSQDRPCRCRLDTVLGMFLAARDGAGLAVLPCYLGDSDDRLIRLGATIEELATDLWLLTHPGLRSTARIRAVLDFVAQSFQSQPAPFPGKRLS